MSWSAVSTDVYEIRLNSYRILDALAVTAVHNEVAFYKNGKPILAFNGNAHSRENGSLSAFAISPDHTLRVCATDKDLNELGGNKANLLKSVKLGELDEDLWRHKIDLAVKVSRFINANDIDYIVLGNTENEAQNSNSVARSLVAALGYEYPSKELENLWAPGDKRNLLPDSFDRRIPVGFSSLNELLLNPFHIIEDVKEERQKPHPKEGKNDKGIDQAAHQTYFDPKSPGVIYPKDETVSDPNTEENNLKRIRRVINATEKDKNVLVADFIILSIKRKTPYLGDIFLAQEKPEDITPEHKKAAEDVRTEMIHAVANEAHLSFRAANSLLLENHKKFIDIVDKCLKNGKIPATHLRPENDIKELLAKEMGISPDELETETSPIPPRGAVETYKKLRAEGKFEEKSPDNPHLLKYIAQYIDASRITSIELPDPGPDESESSPSEVSKEELETQMKSDAYYLETGLRADAYYDVGQILHGVVAKKLGIRVDDILSVDGRQYLQIIKEAYRKGEIPLRTSYPLSEDEQNQLIASELGTDKESLYKHPVFIQKIAFAKLDSAGMFRIMRPNPYLREEIENQIRSYEQDFPKETHRKGSTRKSTVSVDIRNEGGPNMNVSGIPMKDYFAQHVSPNPQLPEGDTPYPQLVKPGAQTRPIGLEPRST